MRIMVNKNTTMEVHKYHEEEVLKSGEVWCHQVDCLGKGIECSNCYFDGLGYSDFYCIEHSKIKVDSCEEEI